LQAEFSVDSGLDRDFRVQPLYAQQREPVFVPRAKKAIAGYKKAIGYPEDRPSAASSYK
jgi:hypothetical protein